ncbi:zinc-binding alcohol dehydrogenase-like protein [Cadophora sp. DSE1049]|nr:zinc-binding alcohol dehydrogenase-like protein [Cadophora sp. DSE1049]
MAFPTTSKIWRVQGTNGFDSLEYNAQESIAALSENEVLVKFHAAALNYRDISIPYGTFPFGFKKGVVPGSDGAGEVIAVGAKVTRFQKGSKVVTQFNQKHIYGSLTSKSLGTALGGDLDGVLRQYGTFNEEGLVLMPKSLDYVQASTLTGAGVTAWNALYGLKPVKTGDVVLTQGTGGVSLFAIQFAKAAGATVIATTSSAAKVQQLKALGADHVINYREVDNWGDEAKKLTGSREGVDHVIEIGGGGTMAQSIKSIRIDGTINVIGWLSKTDEKEPSFLETVSKVFTVRGMFVGSRAMFEEMNAAIDAINLKPVVDSHLFRLEDLTQAYEYLEAQKHVGKVCVTIE